MIDYHNRYFKSVQNTPNGEVDGNTVFHYRQEGKILWATYEGGDIIKGTLVGKILDDGLLDFYYQHLNSSGKFRIGKCKSTPVLSENGLLRLRENWTWLNGDGSSGESYIEEFLKEKQ